MKAEKGELRVVVVMDTGAVLLDQRVRMAKVISVLDDCYNPIFSNDVGGDGAVLVGTHDGDVTDYHYALVWGMPRMAEEDGE